MLGTMARGREEPAEFRPGILLQVFVAGQLTDDLLRAELGDVLSADGFAVQSVIGLAGPITPGQLARRLGMAPTTVSSWVARLERAGIVRRRPNPEDGRSQLIELTPRGRRQLDAARPGFRRAIERVRAELGDDFEEVLAGAGLLVEALRRALEKSTTS